MSAYNVVYNIIIANNDYSFVTYCHDEKLYFKNI